MAKQLTQVHIHTQHANRRPKKVYRKIRRVQPLKTNKHKFSHQASIVYDGKDLRICLDSEGEWHGYPFGEMAVEVRNRDPRIQPGGAECAARVPAKPPIFRQKSTKIDNP